MQVPRWRILIRRVEQARTNPAVHRPRGIWVLVRPTIEEEKEEKERKLPVARGARI